MNFLKILKLIFSDGYSREFTQSFKKPLYKGLLQTNPIWLALLIIIVDDFLELFEFRIGVNE